MLMAAYTKVIFLFRYFCFCLKNRANQLFARARSSKGIRSLARQNTKEFTLNMKNSYLNYVNTQRTQDFYFTCNFLNVLETFSASTATLTQTLPSFSASIDHSPKIQTCSYPGVIFGLPLSCSPSREEGYKIIFEFDCKKRPRCLWL